MKLGAIVVPLNTRFKGEELAYEINDSESNILIVHQEYWPSIDPIRNDLKTIEKMNRNIGIYLWQRMRRTRTSMRTLSHQRALKIF